MSKLVAIAVVLGLTLLLPGAARAISAQDQQEISYIRQFFQVNTASASDTELAQLLDSKQVGPSIRGDVACVVHGQYALNDHQVDEAVMKALNGELQLVVSSDSFTNVLIDSAATRLPAALGILLQVHGELEKFRSQVPLFVKALATLYSYPKYKELLVLYHTAREEGKSAEETEAEMQLDVGEVIQAVEKERSLTEAQLFAQYSYSSACMSLAENNEERAVYGEYINALIAALRSYSQKGGTTEGGLTIVQTAPATLQIVNNGNAFVGKLTIKNQGGSTIATLTGELEPGSSLSVGDGGGSPASVTFTVDGIESVTRSYSALTSELYVGEGFAAPAGEDSRKQELDVEPGPFVANGLSATYKWELGDGAVATEPNVIHSYSCYGQSVAHFTASAGKQTAARTALVERAPPFKLDWSTTNGELAVAPGVPLTFRADPSTPAADTVRWLYGDGESGTGREVTHSFTSAGVYNVTMLVETPGSGCPALSALHRVSVGRSEDWIGLSGTIDTQTLSSSVAGYVVYGPTTIPAGQTLTVGPGVNVKFENGYEGGGQLIVRGSLKVAGTSQVPAVFTSPYDDSAGGHCTCAPAGHTPAPGDWYGIAILEGSSTIEHADIRYARGDIEMQSSGASVLVTGSVLSDAGSGLSSPYANTITVRSSSLIKDTEGMSFSCFACSYSPTISGNRFEEDQLGVALADHVAPHIDHAEFVNVKRAVEGGVAAARTLVTNTTVKSGGGFIVLYGGPFPTGSTWLASDLPYVVIGEATIPSGAQLTLGPHTVVRFAANGSTPGKLIDDGSLLLAGSTAAPATLTSVYDESDGGPCTCAPPGHTAAAGDWQGVLLETGAHATLEHADLRYSNTALELRGANASAQVTNSTIENANFAVLSTAASSSTIESSTLRNDEYGLELNCGCASTTATVTRSSFPGSKTDASISGNAHLNIHGSSFEAQQQGIIASEQASANATGNWWGAASGPRPTGTGASVSGNVVWQPFCANSGCAEAKLTLNPSTLLADGHSQTTASITLTTAGTPRTGDHITLASTDPGQTISSATETKEGTYTATITASHAIASATITASDISVSPAAQAGATLTQTAPHTTVKVAPASIVANGTSQTTATVTVTGPKGPLTGEPIALTSSDTAEKIGPVTNHNNGTYTVTITSSLTVETATITARDTAYGAAASASTTLTQALARKVALSLKPTSLIASTKETSTATISVTAGGSPISGERIVLSSSDRAVKIGQIVDNGNGTYTATLAPSNIVGSVHLTATDTTVSPYATASTTLQQLPPTVQVTLNPSTIPANGVATTTVTVNLTANTVPLPGQQIALASSDPGQMIGPVTDNGNGSYTATITSSLTPGSDTITASDLSVTPAAKGSATLTQS